MPKRTLRPPPDGGNDMQSPDTLKLTRRELLIAGAVSVAATTVAQDLHGQASKTKRPSSRRCPRK